MRKQVFIGFITVFTLLAATGCGGENESENVDLNNADLGEEVEAPLLDRSEVEYESNVEVDAYKEFKEKDNKTMKDCEVFSNESLMNECINDVYLAEAIAKKDKSICNKINVKIDENYCLSLIDRLLTPSSPDDEME